MLKEYLIEDNAPDTPGQLYDLDRDPGETNNVSKEHPEIAERLKRLLDESMASGRSRPSAN